VKRWKSFGALLLIEIWGDRGCVFWIYCRLCLDRIASRCHGLVGLENTRLLSVPTVGRIRGVLRSFFCIARRIEQDSWICSLLLDLVCIPSLLVGRSGISLSHGLDTPNGMKIVPTHRLDLMVNLCQGVRVSFPLCLFHPCFFRGQRYLVRSLTQTVASGRMSSLLSDYAQTGYHTSPNVATSAAL